MTRALLLVVALVLTAGCSFRSDGDASPTDQCVERFMQRVDPARYSEEHRSQLERYVRVTYCERFEAEGWVYEDGTLRIDAHRWLMRAGTSDCAAAEPGKPARRIRCEREPEPILDCALLHYVRKDEVQAYLRQLQRTQRVVCDDGTPLDELGVG